MVKCCHSASTNNTGSLVGKRGVVSIDELTPEGGDFSGTLLCGFRSSRLVRNPGCLRHEPRSRSRTERGHRISPWSSAFDVELDIAAIIRRPRADIDPAEAERHIAGYTILCNGRPFSRSRGLSPNSSPMHRAPRNAPVRDIIGSGTVGTGCTLELSGTHGDEAFPWLPAGDVVTLLIAQLGAIHRPSGRPERGARVPMGL